MTVQRQEPTGTAAGTVLIIDDDPALLGLVRECLADEGYRVVGARSFDEGLALLARECVAFVLADPPRLAGDDPWAALGRLQTAARGAPVVIFSAHRAALFDGWRERGFADLIAKPFDLDDLLRVVGASLCAD